MRHLLLFTVMSVTPGQSYYLWWLESTTAAPPSAISVLRAKQCARLSLSIHTYW